MRYRSFRRCETKTSRSSVVLPLCKATAIGLPAQAPLTILASFSVPNGSSPSFRAPT
jgi:hypothetical protein